MSNWDLDRRYGEAGEAIVAEWRNAPGEVKRKRYPDTKFYLEVEQRPVNGNGVWVPSSTGPEGSDASRFTFVIADTGIVVSFPTVVVAEAVKRCRDGGRPLINGDASGDNPTRGYLVTFRWLLDLAAHHQPATTAR